MKKITFGETFRYLFSINSSINFLLANKNIYNKNLGENFDGLNLSSKL